MKLTREQLVSHVNRLLSGEWTEKEMEVLFREINGSVPCPYSAIQGYIFHSQDLSSEEIVEAMLSHKAIEL